MRWAVALAFAVGVVVAASATAAAGGPVTVLPTASIQAAPQLVTYPGAAQLTGTLTSGGQPLAGQPTSLLSRQTGTDAWTTTTGPSTDANGTVIFAVKPRFNSDYRISFGPTSSYAEASSPLTRVGVRPLIGLRAPAVAPILTPTAFTGSVRPVLPGTLRLERWTAGAWRLVALASTDASGRYAFAVRVPAKGANSYRVRRLADAAHLVALSRTATVSGVDRSLRSGATGADVVVLQKRLIALHYDVPHASGTFDYDTLHAVIAFEKVQRMTRDGAVTTPVWRRLGSPVLPRLLHPLSNVAAVEVDLTTQVLYYAVNARIVRILDVSSGGGYTYTGSDGRPAVAITPTGHFHVVYKVNHWVTSKLGTLYRPAYFNNSGYAIHGEGLVPSYPASHGCVRITVPAMDRMYANLVPGMSVWIYRA